MSNKRIQGIAKPDRFRFIRQDNIGVAAAEDDVAFLQDCFVDTGDLEMLANCSDPKSVVVGRTGSGKTALLRRLSETEDRVIQIHPESLALRHISNSTILKYLDGLGVNLDIFFKLLWRHVFTVELIKYRFEIQDESTQKSLFDRLKQLFSKPDKKRAYRYIEEWGSKFWEDTECRIKETTAKLEADIRRSVGAKFPNIDLGSSSSKTVSLTDKSEITQRAQRVINNVQIKELSDMISLVDEILTDPQKRYFITIDNLDDVWIEDRLRYKLIRALIETVRDFRRIQNAKIVIALRVDLIERVFKLTRGSGFQSEKYESLYLPITWSPNTLTRMLDARIRGLVRRRFTKQIVTHKDLLPNRVDGKPPITFILDRSMMRPRDVIMFFNCCIQQAVDKPTINLTILRQAEGVYSKERLRSLGDEWISDYPGLLDFSEVLKSRRVAFQAGSIACEDIENICLQYCIEYPDQNDDTLSRQAHRLVDGSIDASEFRGLLLQVFYRVGLISLKKETFEPAQWSPLGDRDISQSEISESTRVGVHPMFWRALGIRTK